VDKLPAPVSVDDKHTPDPSKQAVDRFATLKAYRRARGLCDKCAECWCPGHQCAPTVQLHVVQELMDLITYADGNTDSIGAELSSEQGGSVKDAQLFLALSQVAFGGTEGPRTMCFQGTIQNHHLLILVDSGSSHSFLSSHIADKLQGVQFLPSAISVQDANGGIMQCATHLPRASWSIQDFNFSSDLQVLPLQHFDLILGMDWLESFSPMKFHWKLKWMSIPYGNSTVLLHGLLPQVPVDTIVQLCSISVPVQLEEIASSVHPSISALLTEFSSVFAPVNGLPPARDCDHSIPLVAGAKPVYIRPYRYPPALKDEIEKQIQDMLDKGLIQPSSSPFSSPPLPIPAGSQGRN